MFKAVLGQVAVSAARTKDTYLAARYRRIAGRRGKKCALVAVGHSVLIAVWTMLTRDIEYHDLGANHFIEGLGSHGKIRQTRRLIDQRHGYGTGSTPGGPPSTSRTTPKPSTAAC